MENFVTTPRSMVIPGVTKDGQDVPLGSAVDRALSNYFMHLGDQKITNLYEIVVEEVEEALLKFVMNLRIIRGNQSKAAALLGLSRTTLRKKLKQFDML